MTEDLRISKIQIDITFTKETNIPIDVQIKSSIEDIKDQKIQWAYTSACNEWKNVNVTTLVFKTKEEVIRSIIDECLEDYDENVAIDEERIKRFLLHVDESPVGISIREGYMLILHKIGENIDLWRMSDYKNIKLSECLKV